MLVSCPGQHFASGDPLDDPPVRGRWLTVGWAAGGQVGSLGGAPEREQPAQANLPDGERIE
jgi:hypothetical protein